MQELRLVLIIVGALAIAALLFHGLWTSKKEGKSKYAEKSAAKEDDLSPSHVVSDDDFEIVKKEKSESAFDVERNFSHDPLGVDDPLEPIDSDESFSEHDPVDDIDDEELPQVRLYDDIDEPLEEKVIFADGEEEIILKPKKSAQSDLSAKSEPVSEHTKEQTGQESSEEEPQQESEPEDELEVIVLHVHCAGDDPFVGTKLFDSMQQNGLIYGEMDIFHRHNDLSGTGNVLFSVANMMQPGTLAHDDPATFTTKGISFFMTLPCFGEADQNFKLMLKTAQQIADDLGGNVLDDDRNLMTPNRLGDYRSQIREFKARTARKENA